MKLRKIDISKDSARSIFLRTLFPTLIGMLSVISLNIADGAFLGHGAGSDPLAAVNIVAPIYMILTGLGLTLGMGSSVRAGVSMGEGKQELGLHQLRSALYMSLTLGVMLIVGMLSFNRQLCLMFGASEQLLEPAMHYLFWVTLCQPFAIASEAGMFTLRMLGSANASGWIMFLTSMLNIILDYVLVFVLKMGIDGAAIATSFCYSLSGISVIVFLMVCHPELKLFRRGPMLEDIREIYSQFWAGSAQFLGEMSMAALIITGNWLFMKYLREPGVAAFSICCYCLPVAFMCANAVAQSAQPILSYATGEGDMKRIREARQIGLSAALVVGVLGASVLGLGAREVTSLFLSDEYPAWHLCAQGMPLIAAAIPLICINIFAVAYLQSRKRTKESLAVTLMRSFLFLIPAFLLMPLMLGVTGLWTALLAAEALTLLGTILMYIWKHHR